jgi:hypothetical protein
MDKKLLIIGGVAIVALVVVLVLVLRRKKTAKVEEKYYPCSKCQSFGRKVCVNRDLSRQLYNEGIMTETTIPQNGTANWTQPEGDAFYEYQPESGKKGCCGGWS